MNLPMYEKDKGFKTDKNGIPYVVIDFQKVGVNPENDEQREKLEEEVIKKFKEETGKDSVCITVDLCRSPYNDLVLIFYLEEVTM